MVRRSGLSGSATAARRRASRPCRGRQKTTPRSREASYKVRGHVLGGQKAEHRGNNQPFQWPQQRERDEPCGKRRIPAPVRLRCAGLPRLYVKHLNEAAATDRLVLCLVTRRSQRWACARASTMQGCGRQPCVCRARVESDCVSHRKVLRSTKGLVSRSFSQQVPCPASQKALPGPLPSVLLDARSKKAETGAQNLRGWTTAGRVTALRRRLRSADHALPRSQSLWLRWEGAPSQNELKGNQQACAGRVARRPSS